MKAFTLVATGAAVLTSGLGAAPALAQSKQAEVTVYGTDPCPRAADDTIVVCVRRPAEERYRIPPKLRSSGPPQARNSWVNRAKAFASQGATGPMSCSAVGPAGYTGCALQEINQAARERANSTDTETAPK